MAVAAGPSAADQIDGPVNPCRGSKAEYQYCRTENFPYIWSWEVSSGATLRVLGTTASCYRAELTFTSQPVTLTFHQRNPPTVPPVYDVRTYIQPKACAAPAAPRPTGARR